MTDHSLMSLTNDDDLILPQIGYSSRTETDDTSEHTKYIRGPKHHVFYRQPNDLHSQGYNPMQEIHSNEQSSLLNYCYHKPMMF
jgi:hypothetical protein